MLCESLYETILSMIGFRHESHYSRYSDDLDHKRVIFSKSNFLFGNNTEACALAKALGWDLQEDNLEEIAKKLGKFRVFVILFKQ